MPVESRLISVFWLVTSACALSLGWLLPNNYPPWLSFHKDAWIAVTLVPVAGWILWPRKSLAQWHIFSSVVAGLCLVPLLQYVAGMVPLWGTAWVHMLYLLGFLVALQTGAKWERLTPGQCADYVFMAIGFASVISVGMQFYQWMGLESGGMWILNITSNKRYYANITQPNLLASLLLLGVIACSWGFWRKKLSGRVAVLVAGYLLFGVALTSSRTAWLNVLLLAGLALLLRRRLNSKHYVGTIFGLALFFAACVVTLPWLNHMLDFSTDNVPVEYRGLADAARMNAWTLFLDASRAHPFVGFGWGQVARANFSVLSSYPVQGGVFAMSHNLVLDLILWNGYPVGLAIAGFLAWWFWRACLGVANLGHFTLVAFVVVLGVHAMLEYPLQYAYFLLPLGLVIGVLNNSLDLQPVCKAKNWSNVAIWFAAVLALSITVRDYFRVETSFYGLRFDQRGIPHNIPKAPPDVLALTQFRDYLIFVRNIPRSGVSNTELIRMRDVVNSMPSAMVMYKLAANLAMNKHPAEAQLWLSALCKVTLVEVCNAMEDLWKSEAQTEAPLAAVPWPQEYSRNNSSR